MPAEGQRSHVQKEGTVLSIVNTTMHVNILNTHAQEEDSVTSCLMEPPFMILHHIGSGQANMQLSHVKVQQTAVFSAQKLDRHVIIMHLHVTTCKSHVLMKVVVV